MASASATTARSASRRTQATIAQLAMAATLARPWPGRGPKLTTGRPAASASQQVRPPAFSTTTSAPASSRSMSGTHPRIWTPRRWPHCRSSRRLTPAPAPQTTTVRSRPPAIRRRVVRRSPAPHEPATTTATRSSCGQPRLARAEARSQRFPGRPVAPNPGRTTGPGALARRAPRLLAPAAAAGWRQRWRSTSGSTHPWWTAKSTTTVATGTSRRPRRRSSPRTAEARWKVDTARAGWRCRTQRSSRGRARTASGERGATRDGAGWNQMRQISW